MDDRIELRWLEENRATSQGVTWGVPWAKGVLEKNEEFVLETETGEQIPVQSWPVAYWPDGTVKWTGHAVSLKQNVKRLYLKKGNYENIHDGIRIQETDTGFVIDTGSITCRVNKFGSSIIHSISMGGHVYCENGVLVCIREEREGSPGNMHFREEKFESFVEEVILEQKGPIRCVVKISGKHRSLTGTRRWLPFTVRLYFYKSQSSVRIVHSFVFDGDKDKDFIKGLGMTFDVPLKGEYYNRHVRLAGDTGFFSEAIQLLSTWRPRIPEEIYRRQIRGEIISLEDNPEIKNSTEAIAAWDGFKLVQITSDTYMIEKRTQEGCCWIHAGTGHRSAGVAYAGGESGGLAAGIRNFWQKYPASIEIHGMKKDTAALTLWFWSYDAQPMDLRHYDTVTHVESHYEGSEELRSTPYGIANTSEILIQPYEKTPNYTELSELASLLSSPGLFVCAPEYYHKVKAFGVWSLVDHSSKAKSFIENQLDRAIEFYKEEVEQRKWYGFWNYGDFMHTYDAVRHTWKYDMGGYAWQNTELVPTYWLWYSFLRTGRSDIFRMAEAMSRHTMDVDTYHIGEYKGLGSRHNVVHWGCGCKEARISMAGHHRFYFYLTCDERTGDVLDEVKDADFAYISLDPLRAYYPRENYPTHVRTGPDWAAFCSNWLTQWERYEDTHYRDKILTGISCLKKMPYRLYGGTVFGYNPETGELIYPGEERGTGSHLVLCMGGAQIWLELSDLIQDQEWDEMLAEYGEFYTLSAEEKTERTSGAVSGNGFAFPIFSASLLAYAARKRKDRELGKKVWEILSGKGSGHHTPYRIEKYEVGKNKYFKEIHEIPWISTNTIAQWALNLIVCLELAGDCLTDDFVSKVKSYENNVN
ncbi:hypothetical protein Cst_c02230 [Thermoclostridium stercorarium subsp. stercorarium DSM 8532]|jgi:hypothetical protein|uniref:Tat pathway signal sequence domain protein n=3 Tax=Thermoclostridium stercorarium TaxID=1510 RepID=L7VKH0_THES1|nr:hypothetical protein [Thermoclostridium stercorarium]AGC67247.1 hypothetical protein Cst_c02230 [Thermoclostridium stercorarium subsp. stercorarium DSM 8532]AGI38319.1 hypothetical protein Clst_0213 [Thermoclostridium stercorarium subsp. stercorarium DSM 8532]ANW97754.1 hypothetical protein CSTERTH_01255 [Thermoclostridium stercorarium subsp. thermolacticum DSM 2910]ANX00280.1 hypothetical protein CSTERLE_01075 [Thermoclostridium stercorarium subsp. leptospartum DSM 9219]